MRRAAQCIALFMAAFWLPATQHCALNALGIIEARGAHEDHGAGCVTHHEAPRHTHDTCDLVERPLWLDTATHLSAPSPQASRHAPAFGLAEIIPAIGRAAPIPRFAFRIPHFQDWFPSRHFTARAAPMSRAPSPAPA